MVLIPWSGDAYRALVVSKRTLGQHIVACGTVEGKANQKLLTIPEKLLTEHLQGGSEEQ